MLLEASVGTVYLQELESSPTTRTMVPAPKEVQVVGKLGLQAGGAYWTVPWHPHPAHPLLLHPQDIDQRFVR